MDYISKKVAHHACAVPEQREELGVGVSAGLSIPIFSCVHMFLATVLCFNKPQGGTYRVRQICNWKHMFFALH